MSHDSAGAEQVLGDALAEQERLRLELKDLLARVEAAERVEREVAERVRASFAELTAAARAELEEIEVEHADAVAALRAEVDAAVSAAVPPDARVEHSVRGREAGRRERP